MKDITILLQSPLFWDVDKKRLHPETNKRFIICRVLDRGDIEAVNMVFHYYEKPIIKEALINARFIEKKTIAFFSNYFDLSPADFKSWEADSTSRWNR